MLTASWQLAFGRYLFYYGRYTRGMLEVRGPDCSLEVVRYRVYLPEGRWGQAPDGSLILCSSGEASACETWFPQHEEVSQPAARWPPPEGCLFPRFLGKGELICVFQKGSELEVRQYGSDVVRETAIALPEPALQDLHPLGDGALALNVGQTLFVWENGVLERRGDFVYRMLPVKDVVYFVSQESDKSWLFNVLKRIDRSLEVDVIWSSAAFSIVEMRSTSSGQLVLDVRDEKERRELLLVDPATGATAVLWRSGSDESASAGGS